MGWCLPSRAAWRPGAGRHNIWELIVHAAYWKYIGLRRLTGGARGSFPLKGSNWMTRPQDPDGAALKSDVALLDDMHRALRETVAGLSPRDLDHAGQIQLLKRLAPPR